MPAWAQMSRPRRALGLIPAAWLAAPALLSPALLRPASAQPVHSPWFDPTQLPSYSGRLERWLANPAGAVDRGLFREGTQFVFPPSEGEALMQSISPGGPICVWGIRARNAPVVLTLAWAKADTEPASFVERPAWFVAKEHGRTPLRLTGRILAPLLTPRGEGMGVIVADGGAIHLSVEAHRSLNDLLTPGEPITAEGPGTEIGGRIALEATTLGREPGNMRPVPQR